jgi:hypothetical protein
VKNKEPFIVMDTGDGIFGRSTPQEAMDFLWKKKIVPTGFTDEMKKRCEMCLRCADLNKAIEK